jgi:hypothetical protein
MVKALAARWVWVGLAAAGLASTWACETVRVPGTPVAKDGGSSSGDLEDGSVDEDAATNTDGSADAGGPSKRNVPTTFRRTLDCSAGACNTGTCNQNLGPNCGLVSPCRGRVSPLVITEATDFPLRIKTPAVSTADATCKTLCGPSSTTKYAISLQIKTPNVNVPLAIKVPPPWKVSVGEDRYGPIYCGAGGDPLPAFPASSCIGYYGSGFTSLAITTDDAPAASVDVVIDVLPIAEWPTEFDGQCPFN